MTSETVKLLIGLERKTYYVHKDLLCEKSYYFKGAFGDGFEESVDGAMILEDADLEVFEMFLSWFYGTPVPLIKTGLAYIAHIKLYVMADRYGVERLMNNTMDRLRLYMDEHTTRRKGGSYMLEAYEVEYIYENTMECSQLRKFASDYVTASLFDSDDDRKYTVYLDIMRDYGDITLDVFGESERLRRLVMAPGERYVKPVVHAGCYYHTHNYTECG